MGEPVRIVDLARDLITLSGLRPGFDIDIKFTGVRSGEKLHEQLSTDAEHADKTKHPKIFIGRVASPSWSEVVRGLDNVLALADSGSGEQIRAALRAMAPEYTGASAVSSATAIVPPAPAESLDQLGLARARRNDGTGPLPALAAQVAAPG
jgi:FlaA1/EpsC-like NDP-sugar epimerase